MEQEEKLCIELETWREFTYLGGRVSACGGCQVDVFVRRCGWIKLEECGKLLYEKLFPLEL